MFAHKKSVCHPVQFTIYMTVIKILVPTINLIIIFNYYYLIIIIFDNTTNLSIKLQILIQICI